MTPEKLWPYKKTFAFLVIPLTWIFFALIFMLGQRYAGWANGVQGAIIIVVAIISVCPLLLVLLDFFSERGGKIAVKGFEIDFGRIDLEKADVKRTTFGLPDNIGITGAIITDSAPMNIVGSLEDATNHDMVVLNLKSGDAWWVTRLLALCAGAVRTGSPQIFVFKGKKENIQDYFLGWARPKDMLRAILNDNDAYKMRYERSMKIARQVVQFSDPGLIPAGITLSADVARYAYDGRYQVMGDGVTEQIIMDQMVVTTGYPDNISLEANPDRLNLVRLESLFGHCLYKQSIELTAPNEEQIQLLLQTRALYISLVRGGQFESILQRSDGEQLVLKELFQQSRKK